MVDQVRQINDAGLSLIKSFEGLYLRSYLCPAGVWTIGWGHTRTAKPGMMISELQAEQLLQSDLLIFERAVSRLVEVALNDNQFSALVCFTFNVGVGNFEQSTLLKCLNKGWYSRVPEELARWNKVKGETFGGLVRRRAAEAKLFDAPV